MLAVAILETFGETKVDHVDAVPGRLSRSDEEVIRFDIPVDNPALVALLDSLNHLNANHQDGFEVETPLARLKQILEGGSEQIHDHDVEANAGDRVIGADVVELGYAC